MNVTDSPPDPDSRRAAAIRGKLDALYSVESSEVDQALEQAQFEILEYEAW